MQAKGAKLPKNIPTIGSDQWAEWITQELLRPGGQLTDAYIAQLVDTPDSAARLALERLVEGGYAGALSTAIQHTDDAVSALQTALLAAISQSAVSATANANQYADVQDRKVLADAQAYTDAHSGTGGVSQAYVDAGDNAAVQTASEYTDVVSRETRTESYRYSDAGDADTLTAAKAYTDEHGGTGDGATQAYVDTADAATLRSASDYADAGDTAAKAYADDGDIQVATGAREYADGKTTETLNMARTTATQLADDARTVAQAYADEQDDVLVDGLSEVIDNKIAPISEAITSVNDRFGTSTKEITGQNLDDLRTTGNYRGSNLTNSPANDSIFYIEVLVQSDLNWCMQRATGYYGSSRNRTYTRIMNGSEWAPWYESVKSVAARTGDVVLTKADVGLNNVNNTADANKPMSSATKDYVDATQTDTGWVAVSAIAGYTSSVAYRIKNGLVTLRGSLTSTGAFSSVAAVVTLPAAARPSTAQAYLGIGTATSVFRITVNTNGTINVDPTSGNTGTVVWFSQISYLLG